MNEKFTRTEALITSDGLKKLNNSHIVVCGCGGVGSYVFEALVRSGVGKITVIDNDVVSVSNINRQLIALDSTVGKSKVEVAKARALDINPDARVTAITEFITPNNVADIIDTDVDYIIDAIDFVPAKVALAVFAKQNNINIIECLGTGNRLDATKFKIIDVYKTSGCPLAKKMRVELKKAGVSSLDVLVSDAPVVKPDDIITDGKRTVGSVAFVPSVAGLIIAGYVINKILEN